MKRTLKQGLESIVNSGRNIGKFIKKNAKIGLTALALPVIFTSTAKAVEGGVSIDYSISSVGGADWRLNHTLTPGVSEGLDEYDAGYEDLFPPDGVAVKAVSSVDGIEVVSDVRPSSDSPSGGGCSFSIVTDGRNVVIPEGTTHGFSVSVSGYEGCNVSVGGYNAREVGWVSLGTLPAGTYSGGLSTGSASISFSCPEPPPPPPPPPPPEPPGPEPEPPKPGPTPAGPLEELLHIKNYIDNSYSHIFKLAHKPGASEGLDNYDSLYTKSFDYWEKGSKIVSIIPSGRRSHELEFDVRPKDSTGSVYLLLSLVSQSGQPLTISSNNELRLSFPSDSHEYDFSGNPITLQQHDSFNQSATFPIYDVRQVIAKNNGIIKLDDLDGIYNSEEPYAFLELAFNEFLLSDLNKDDIIDFEDCSILADDLGKTNVNSIADISSPKGKGVPDRKVDYYDLRTFFEEWSNNWILSGDAKIITDAERGNVIEFDGDRDYAKINDLGRKLTDGFTYSACVKTYVGDDGVQRGIVSQSGSPSMVKTSDGKLGVWMDFESGAKRPCYSGEIPVNKWTYVAIAWSKESKTLKTYIDGELQCTWASPPGKELKPGSGPFYIGKTLSTNQYFNGAIDDIMIFNRALSDGEIKAISPVKAVSPVVDDNMEEFETGDFSKFDWRHYGEAYWTVTSEEAYSGTYSAQAGAIGHGENTTLERVVDCVQGYITFHRKVSSEEDFDYLRFYIDGVEQDKWSGNQHWNRVSFPVTAGTRIFEWTYSKDYSNYRGSDTAWIDNIVFPRE